jgi:hypothetical protein
MRKKNSLKKQQPMKELESSKYTFLNFYEQKIKIMNKI